ncbi:hypothetical protein AMECASPLE_005695 [Ameca splendens]|uniref:Uncharacterized protein n=1 Tax=Ameca splendens TaxID=208324 RepID=A0ABV1A5G7_9TELE
MLTQHKPLRCSKPDNLRLRELLTFPGLPPSSTNLFVLIRCRNPEDLHLYLLINYSVKHVCVIVACIRAVK